MVREVGVFVGYRCPEHGFFAYGASGEPGDEQCPVPSLETGRACGHYGDEVRRGQCDRCRKGAGRGVRLVRVTDFWGTKEWLCAACAKKVAAEVLVDQRREAAAYRDDRDVDLDFADPGGRSSLRATNNAGCRCGGCRKKVGATDSFCRHCGTALNPRKHSCPDCGRKGVLTDEDVRLHYVCDRCANRREGYGVRWDY